MVCNDTLKCTDQFIQVREILFTLYLMSNFIFAPGILGNEADAEETE